MILSSRMMLTSKEDFENAIKYNAGKLVMYLYDKECHTHEHLLKVLEELSKDFTDIAFKSVEYPIVKDLISVNVVPTIIFYDVEKIVNTLDGCSISALVSFLRGWTKGLQETTLERIKRLIQGNPVILFMKGNKEEPFCRFSRAVVEMLNKSGILFEGYNIFEDPELREELKKYSRWPTYPQLYVNGNLIGGHDIIKELFENDKLRNEIPKDYLILQPQ